MLWTYTGLHANARTHAQFISTLHRNLLANVQLLSLPWVVVTTYRNEASAASMRKYNTDEGISSSSMNVETTTTTTTPEVSSASCTDDVINTTGGSARNSITDDVTSVATTLSSATDSAQQQQQQQNCSSNSDEPMSVDDILQKYLGDKGGSEMDSDHPSPPQVVRAFGDFNSQPGRSFLPLRLS